MSQSLRKRKSKSTTIFKKKLCSLNNIKFSVGQTYEVKMHFSLHHFLQVNARNKNGKKCKLIMGAGIRGVSGAVDVARAKDPQFVLKIPDIQYQKCHQVKNDSFQTKLLNQCANVRPEGLGVYKGRLTASKIKVLKYILKNAPKKQTRHVYLNNVYYYNVVKMPFQFDLFGAYFPNIKTQNCRTFLYLFHTKPKDILEVIKNSKLLNVKN